VAHGRGFGLDRVCPVVDHGKALDMRIQDTLAGIGMLILAYLVLRNWRGANALLATAAGAGSGVIRTLQGR